MLQLNKNYYSLRSITIEMVIFFYMLEALKRKHPEYNSEYWELLSAISEGADCMTDAIKRKLMINPDMRPEVVIKDRIKLANYNNKLAPILNRFNSELFKNPGVPVGSSDPFWSENFFKYGGLLDGDDDGRCSLNTFLSSAMMSALICGKAIAQIDTKLSSNAISLADQKASGELNPYIILHPRSALWDWKTGRNGFDFCKLHQFQLIQETWDSPRIPQHIFTIYYRQNEKILTSKYVVKRIPKDNKPLPLVPFIEAVETKDIIIEPVIENQLIFNVRGKFEFPIATLTLPKSLWMAAQLFDCQKSYFNQTAALEYALYTNNYSMPVITGVDDESDDPVQNRAMGDGYYLTLKTGQQITNFERSGENIKTAIQYRNEIKRDIYDVLQQIAMSASDGAGIVARSGVSKAEDRRPEQILLEKYGQIIKEFILQILKPAAIAHGEIVDWSITGYDDFLGFDLNQLLQDMQAIEAIDIPSPTFKKEVQKHFIKRAGRVYDLDPMAISLSMDEIG